MAASHVSPLMRWWESMHHASLAACYTNALTTPRQNRNRMKSLRMQIPDYLTDHPRNISKHSKYSNKSRVIKCDRRLRQCVAASRPIDRKPVSLQIASSWRNSTWPQATSRAVEVSQNLPRITGIVLPLLDVQGA